MYEVEKNFNLTPEEKMRLLSGAKTFGKIFFTDVYYDSPIFDLTKRDIWLRKRGEKFEVKIPAEPSVKVRSRKTKHYLEIETEDEIFRTFSLPDGINLIESIRLAGYTPFCICTTTRRSFGKQDFNIVIDHVTYSDADWSYETSEIELLVSTSEDISEAEDKIMEFAEQHGLKEGDAPSKIIEYLRRNRPEHYRILVESGTITRTRMT